MRGGHDINVILSPVSLGRGGSSGIGVPSETRAGPLSSIWQRLRRPLLSEEGRKNQVCMNLMVTSIYWTMRRLYNRQYGTNSVAGGRARRLTSSCHMEANTGEGIAGPKQPNQEWEWRGWPELNPWLTRYRVFSCLWMAYVLIKNSFRDELVILIDYVFDPRLPANCYLPGRFIIADDVVQRTTATMFAFLNLLWRYIQLKAHNRLDMSIIYYLFLNDRDISKYYTLLSHPAPSIQQLRRWQPSEHVELGRLPLGTRLRPPWSSMDSRERMMHHIMSYRVDYTEGEVFRLRPNRTPEACLRLRSTLANSTLLVMPLFVLNAMVVFYLFFYALMQAQHALSNYPGCNPRLEQATKGRQIDESAVYLGEHVPYVLAWDVVENWILWFDSGLACYVGPSFMFIYNYDLTIYWAHLHDKIEYVHQVILDLNDIDECSQEGLALARRHEIELWLDELVFDLQMQIQDMIKQIKQADCFLTDATSSYLVVWFSLFAYFIYKSATVRSGGSLPLALLLTLSLMAVVVTLIYASLLTLHRRMHKSYPLICSLMAHDRSHHKRNFISILDYFVHNRTCYTVFRLKSMTATSYLTIVGWSFSCYFLLSKV